MSRQRSCPIFLEVKASKGMHKVCIEKSPDRHLSIHPHIRTENSSTGCTVGFVKCLDIAIFCFILNQSGQL